MMELRPPNVSTAQYGDFGVQNGSVPSSESTLQPLPLDPWDVALCVSGTIISCENAALLAVLAVLAVLVVTPAFRVPVFLLVGSLAAADLLVGLRLILRFASISLVPSEALALGTAGLLLAAFTASVRSVLAIAAERFVSLQHAFTYSSGRAGGRTRLTLLLAWGASLCCGPLPALRWNCVRDPSSCGSIRPLRRPHLAALSVSFLAAFAVLLQLCAQISRIAFGTHSTWPRRGSSQGGRRHGAQGRPRWRSRWAPSPRLGCPSPRSAHLLLPAPSSTSHLRLP